MFIRSSASLILSLLMISASALGLEPADSQLPPLPASWTINEKLDGTQALRRLKALTGFTRETQFHDFGDPSPPRIEPNGDVVVTTTGGMILKWTGPQASEAFLKALPPVVEIFNFEHADGTPFSDALGEDVWDVTLETNAHGEEVLYGSAMSPEPGQAHAVWPDDNWNRRTYEFEKIGNAWREHSQPLFGALTAEHEWLGHTYGHSFLACDGQRYIFYERVNDDTGDRPWSTSIYARKMIDDLQADGNEIPLLSPTYEAWPSALRWFGGNLIEGPRVIHLDHTYLMTFSAGDYSSERYAIHAAWSSKIEGPYKPFLTDDGRDLKDFGAEVEKIQPITWGAGRAALFKMDGKWWALFHGIPQDARDPDPTSAYRMIYLAPVRVTEPSAGSGSASVAPSLEILSSD